LNEVGREEAFPNAALAVDGEVDLVVHGMVS
jgi:hypothetical protein